MRSEKGEGRPSILLRAVSEKLQPLSGRAALLRGRLSSSSALPNAEALHLPMEMAVAAFLQGRIKFPDIPRVVEAAMKAHQRQPLASLDQVLGVDRWARDFAQQLINRGL